MLAIFRDILRHFVLQYGYHVKNKINVYELYNLLSCQQITDNNSGDFCVLKCSKNIERKNRRDIKR